jgi:hypothetical protein
VKQVDVEGEEYQQQESDMHIKEEYFTNPLSTEQVRG